MCHMQTVWIRMRRRVNRRLTRIQSVLYIEAFWNLEQIRNFTDDTSFSGLRVNFCLLFLFSGSSFIVKRDGDPFFLKTPDNITVREGELAVLKCHIDRLGPKMVNVVGYILSSVSPLLTFSMLWTTTMSSIESLISGHIHLYTVVINSSLEKFWKLLYEGQTREVLRRLIYSGWKH